jgi:hypothetical protein
MGVTRNLKDACTICGGQCSINEHGFLIAEDHWRDKLQILHWDEFLASEAGMHATCCPAHLQQLVIHWMTTGSLDHPFARLRGSENPARRSDRPGWTAPERALAARTGRAIGELSVHRESMQRVLRENPQSLQTILDALLSALQKERSRPQPKIDWEAEAARNLQRDI